MDTPRTLPWDWYPGTVPANAVIDETAYVETTFSFVLYRSQEPVGVRIGRGASTYLGTMFDAGPRARIRLGDYALVHGARIICDAEVEIGAYALISWNVVLMDTYRVPANRHERRRLLERLAGGWPRRLESDVPARPVRIGRNVWIGFDACVLPGVTVGDGAVIGARSVVADDVPAYTVVAGNPAASFAGWITKGRARMTAERPHKGKIIVFGILFWYPLAGVTYQFLHYLLGLRRLGYDPYYVEDSGRWVYDPRINDLSPDAAGNIAAVLPALQAHGFGERWAFRGNYPDGKCYGMSEEQILRLYREADAFLNVTGAQEIREEHRACRRRIYVESDPFAIQVKLAKGDPEKITALEAHDTHFSFGENLGASDCDVPIERFRWLPTRQPVALDLWAGPPAPAGAAYTTITTWHNKGKNIDYRGDTYYWTKDREFEKFLDLPHLRKGPFELAAGVTPEVRQLLIGHGWRQVHSVEVSKDPDCYRTYIQGSRAEFTVARDQYVRPNTGWFSDRSACYLAASRPVITQETGFSKFLPTGKGLFGFKTMDDILAAVDAIESDYEGNCRAARAIAAEYFAAENIIGSLMERAGL